MMSAIDFAEGGLGDRCPSRRRKGLLLFLLGVLAACGSEARTPTTTLPASEALVGEYAQAADTVSLLEDGGDLYLYFWEAGDREGERWPGERVRLSTLTDSSFVLEGRPDTARARRGEEEGDLRALEIAGRELIRIELGGEGGGTFRIDPLRPPSELRDEALAAEPPLEEGDFLPSDLVELTDLDPTFRLDIRYATTNNFMGEVFYSSPRAFLQRPAAEALVQAHEWLKERGYGLLIHDGYRPWYVTKMFWDATPERLKTFVADPAGGSRHNRGAAVDLTLFELETGEVAEMPGGYDEMSPRSYVSYPGGTSRQRRLRDLLRTAMESHGFTVYPAEWWHYDYKDWGRYRIGNETFEEIGEG